MLLLETYGDACVYCGGPAETWDHLIPVAAGGLTEQMNMAPACRSCNSSKKDRDLLDWAPRLLANEVVVERLARVGMPAGVP